MKIAVRMDDITPDMDWNGFNRFEKLLDICGIQPLIGVVPCCRDEKLSQGAVRKDFWEWLKGQQEKGWCIAQHGCYHQYTTKKGGLFPLNRFSEYAGVPLETQRELIGTGKEVLESHGIHTDIFMAPGHTFDRNTLRVLEEKGFRYVTDGFGRAPYRRGELIFLPVSVKRQQAFTDREGYTTLVFHTNGMKEAEIAAYEKLFCSHQDRFISYRELLEQQAEPRGAAQQAAEYGMATMKRLAVKLAGALRG